MPILTLRKAFLFVAAIAVSGCYKEIIDPVPTVPPVTTVTLSRDTATIVPGASVKIAATPGTSIGPALDRAVLWTSSDNTKATVSGDGTVLGVAPGSAVISATSESITARATITVLDGGLISPQGGTVRAAGGVVTLVAPAAAVSANTSVVVQAAANAPSAAGLIQGTSFTLSPVSVTFSPLATLTIKYSAAALGQVPKSSLSLYFLNGASWESIASTVDSASGAVSASVGRLGTYAIIGSTSPAAVASITLDVTSVSLYSGLTRQVNPTLKDANGNVLTGRTVAFTSSNGAVASVNSAGSITAAAFGSATVTASVEGKSATVSVSVKHDPIIFLHGFNSSGAIWGTMIGRLVADGWLASDMLAWSYDYNQSNVTIAQQLKTKVDSITSATGALKVDIVTHSMGALSSRYYSRDLGGSDKIEAWVSLAGPNHGTTVANFCAPQSCVEMRPSSAFLTALNTGDETPGTPRYATWRTPCDQATTPPESVILAGATNTETACIGHSDLYIDLTVYAQVRDWIR